MEKVCCLPVNSSFGPLDKGLNKDCIISMTGDEYEAIRLIDLEGFQEDCALQMNIAGLPFRAYTMSKEKACRSLVNARLFALRAESISFVTVPARLRRRRLSQAQMRS
jgi:predicted DNA-binding protein (UPF0251 family)